MVRTVPLCWVRQPLKRDHGVSNRGDSKVHSSQFLPSTNRMARAANPPSSFSQSDRHNYYSITSQRHSKGTKDWLILNKTWKIINVTRSLMTRDVSCDQTRQRITIWMLKSDSDYHENVPLVEFMYLVFTRKPGGITVGDSGLYCCVPCLSSAIISLCLLIQMITFHQYTQKADRIILWSDQKLFETEGGV